MSEFKVVRPVSRDEMTEDEFDEKMARGVAQAQAGEGVLADDFFHLLKRAADQKMEEL